MASSNLIKYTNILLRASTLGGRFIFIFLISRFVNPDVIGEYGLLTASISLMMYILGLDFYMYTIREVIKIGPRNSGEYIKNHIALVACLYVICTPIVISIFYFDFLPKKLIWWFIVILILEHVNQEISRFLIAFSRQTTASFSIFFRLGAWGPLIAILMYLSPETRELEYVLIGWIFGGILSLAIGIYSITNLGISSFDKEVNWSWIKRGVKVAIPLLAATVFIRSIFTVDRYWINQIAGAEVLGAYVLFMGIGGALLAILDAGVFVFSYPKLIEKYNATDRSAYNRELLNMYKQTFALIIIFGVVTTLSLDIVLSWANKDIYFKYKDIFYLILGGVTTYSLSMVAHYGLYAEKRDKEIFICNLLSLIFFFVSCLFYKKFINRAYAVPLSLFSAFSFLFFIKSCLLVRHKIISQIKRFQ